MDLEKELKEIKKPCKPTEHEFGGEYVTSGEGEGATKQAVCRKCGQLSGAYPLYQRDWE
jgi:hypothetical protein